MPTESGDNKLIGNFRKLIDEVTADPDYNPSNDALKIPALEAKYAAGDSVVSSVAAVQAPHKLAITDRESAFAGLRPLAVRSRNFLKASGVPKGVVEDVETYVRKLSGGRKSAKPKQAPTTPDSIGDGSNGSSSASQMSYDNQVGHLESYIEILRNVPTYNPNEADLKVTALTELAASLTDKSNTVSSRAAALDQARGLRDHLLYLGDDSIIETALLVKSYVQSALGSRSQLYKKIKPLQFKRARKGS